MAKKLGAWVFGRVTDDTVDDTLKYLVYSWYAIAVVQAIGLTIMVVGQHASAGDLIDPVAAAMGGYFLSSRKSRALAIALLFYALLIFAVTLANRFGMSGGGGTNVILAIVIVWAGWRGIPVTWAYQRRRCAEVHWLPAILVTVLALGLGIAACFLVAMLIGAAGQIGSPLSTAWTEFAYASALFFPPALTVAILSRKWPFTNADPACPWPPRESLDIPG